MPRGTRNIFNIPLSPSEYANYVNLVNISTKYGWSFVRLKCKIANKIIIVIFYSIDFRKNLL